MIGRSYGAQIKWQIEVLRNKLTIEHHVIFINHENRNPNFNQFTHRASGFALRNYL
jgi:hypothetical protein